MCMYVCVCVCVCVSVSVCVCVGEQFAILSIDHTVCGVVIGYVADGIAYTLPLPSD